VQTVGAEQTVLLGCAGWWRAAPPPGATCRHLQRPGIGNPSHQNHLTRARATFRLPDQWPV